jgi:hypothetical protein
MANRLKLVKYEVHRIFAIHSGMHVPNIEKLLDLMVKELKDKFRYYGNSWEDKDHAFWMERLNNEVAEYGMAMDDVARKRKAINIANLALMAAETVDNG